MVELKSYKMVDEDYCDNALCVVPSNVYLKSEADEVIAELKNQVHEYAQGLYEIQSRTENEIRHGKYKRCLAMAEWCDAEADVVDAYGYYDDISWYQKWQQKWYERWLKIAEQFKEAK